VQVDSGLSNDFMAPMSGCVVPKSTLKSIVGLNLGLILQNFISAEKFKDNFFSYYTRQHFIEILRIKII
jgi:hypothetical protein